MRLIQRKLIRSISNPFSGKELNNKIELNCIIKNFMPESITNPYSGKIISDYSSPYLMKNITENFFPNK